MDDYLNKIYREEKKFTENDVIRFSELTGDKNPIHLDEDFAKKSIFGDRIIHGMLAASYFSKILGMDFPGPGTIYLGQNIKFKKPIKIDELITFELKIVEVNSEKNNLTIKTTCYNKIKEIIIEGEAFVKIRNII
ncbi:MAG: MaoC family dehydratase [Bacteroidetes bacterium]|nr:MaoC family dehydratase [Bacteroidota bacterium]